MNNITTQNIRNALPNIPDYSAWELYNVVEQSTPFLNHKVGIKNYFIEHVSYDKFLKQYYATVKDTSELPFEYRVIRYYANKDSYFKFILKDLLEEACFAEFLEWYEYIVKNILQEDVQEMIGVKFGPDCENWIIKAKESNILGWAFTPELFLLGKDLFRKNYSKVFCLGKMMIPHFNRRNSSSIIDKEYFKSDHAQFVLDCLENVFLNNDSQYFDKILEKRNLPIILEIRGWSYDYNDILLKYILDKLDILINYT